MGWNFLFVAAEVCLYGRAPMLGVDKNSVWEFQILSVLQPRYARLTSTWKPRAGYVDNGVGVGQCTSDRLDIYKGPIGYPPCLWTAGCQRTYFCMVQRYGATVLDWYQDRCWKFGPTIVSGMSSVILSRLIQHWELVACLSAKPSIYWYSPPFWAA